jgi:hypothetical protein
VWGSFVDAVCRNSKSPRNAVCPEIAAMIITNRNGLTTAQKQKVMQPYARNSGAPVDFEAAAREATAFFSENPDLIKGVGALLNESR